MKKNSKTQDQSNKHTQQTVTKGFSQRCIRLKQGIKKTVYQFALTGEELLQVADISRIERGDAGDLIGYQRNEATQHIKEITEYLNGSDVLFPHALIIAFNTTVKFEEDTNFNSDDPQSCTGVMKIQLPDIGKAKPGWIVDGQQRALAISRSKRPDLPIPICAFITDDIETQREQFIRINNSKPLPKGLVEELLPEVTTSISGRFTASKIASTIINQLNHNQHSPFRGMIRRASSTIEERKSSIIQDGPLSRVIKESINHPSGCLYPYFNVATLESDTKKILELLIVFWTAVKNVFNQAWGKTPHQSRLMHGAGLTTMGRLMDRIMPQIDVADSNAIKLVEKELQIIEPFCHWTKGSWEELGLNWNEIQNLSHHIRPLSNHLIRIYLQKKSDI